MAKEILRKLQSIQAELFVPKGQKNSFGGYNYRSCEDILKTVKPLVEKQNCVLHITNKLEHIGEFNYVEATVYLTDIETGDFVLSTAHAREEATKKGMDGSQISGSSSSYARKYALAGLFCIDNEKDSDATNTGDKEPKKQQSKAEKNDDSQPYISDTQIGIIQTELDRTGVSESVITNYANVSKLSDMTQADYVKVMAKLSKTPTKGE